MDSLAKSVLQERKLSGKHSLLSRSTDLAELNP